MNVIRRITGNILNLTNLRTVQRQMMGFMTGGFEINSKNFTKRDGNKCQKPLSLLFICHMLKIR